MIKAISNIYLLIFLLCLTSCGPFNLSPSNSNTLLQLDTVYDKNHRIVDTLSIKLNWSEIEIENFNLIQLARLNEHRNPLSYPVEAANDGWIIVLDSDDPFKVSCRDPIDDDAPFQYRLRYYDTNWDYIESSINIYIKPTTSVFVPLEFDSVSFALKSYIIDPWDTIFVCMSEFDLYADTIYATKPDTLFSLDSVLVIDIPCD